MEREQERRYAEFLASSGIKQEDIADIIEQQKRATNRKTEQQQGQENAAVVVQDDLLPSKIEEEVDYDERLTDIQIKDGINRFKLLALKVLTYSHVVSGSSMAPIFLRDLSQQEFVNFHLNQADEGSGDK